MTTPGATTLPPSPPERRQLSSAVRLGLGLSLLVPALVAWVISYVLPTVDTVRGSFYKSTLVGGGADQFVGTANYKVIGDSGFGFALSLALVPLVIVLVLGPLLAWLADRAGTAGRLATLGVLALPMVCFAPIGLAVAWQLQHERDSGPGLIGATLWLSTFGLVCGVAVTCYLSALRQADPQGRRS